MSVEHPQVRADEQARGDPLPVVGRVGGAVLNGPVIVSEPREPRVFHAVALLVSGRQQDPLPQLGIAGEGGVVGSRHDLAQQVGGGGGTRPGQQAAVRLRQRVLEIGARELGGKSAQDGLGEFIRMSLAGQDVLQVRPAPASGRGVRRGGRPEPWLEGPLRARADDGRAEADRGEVPFTDAPHAERHPGLARAQPALVRAEHRARVAQGRALHRVLRREGRSQQQGARRRQLTGLFDVRGDDRGMPPQDRLIVVVATAEIAEQACDQPLDVSFGQAHDPADDLAGPRTGTRQLLARQEKPRDDAGRIGSQPGLDAVRDHSSSLVRRACCAVASIARVDSAPWLRLRPRRSRPS